MKKAYTPPAIKTVSFRPEVGFLRSNPSSALLELELLNGEARGEQYQYDDWNSSSSSNDNTQFAIDDWGTL